MYDGNKEDFLTKYYRNTLVGYSFSKSLSLPGERIGYVVVPDEAADAEELIRGIVDLKPDARICRMHRP